MPVQESGSSLARPAHPLASERRRLEALAGVRCQGQSVSPASQRRFPVVSKRSGYRRRHPAGHSCAVRCEEPACLESSGTFPSRRTVPWQRAGLEPSEMWSRSTYSTPCALFRAILLLLSSWQCGSIPLPSSTCQSLSRARGRQAAERSARSRDCGHGRTERPELLSFKCALALRKGKAGSPQGCSADEAASWRRGGKKGSPPRSRLDRRPEGDKHDLGTRLVRRSPRHDCRAQSDPALARCPDTTASFLLVSSPTPRFSCPASFPPPPPRPPLLCLSLLPSSHSLAHSGSLDPLSPGLLSAIAPRPSTLLPPPRSCHGRLELPFQGSAPQALAQVGSQRRRRPRPL